MDGSIDNSEGVDGHTNAFNGDHTVFIVDFKGLQRSSAQKLHENYYQSF